MTSKVVPLFTPIKFRGLTLKNRIVVSPMCQYSCENQDGKATEWHLAHLVSRAAGGSGLVIFEASAVTAEGRISPQDLGIWSDDHIEGLSRITTWVKKQGAATGIQLAHAGRKASVYAPWMKRGQVPISDGGWEPVSASPIPWSSRYTAPRELTTQEVKGVVGDFVQAAQRAVKAGFDVIELHGAHGYLLHQFWSPLTNKRTDRYGLDRQLLPIEVTKAVRSVIPDSMPLFVRLSCSDFVSTENETGITVDDAVKLSVALKEAGADLIDCSSGGAVPYQKIPSLHEGYQAPFAEEIKRKASIATGAVGMITKPSFANALITDGKADLVLLARELLRNPSWPGYAAKELGNASVPYVPQYERSWM